jgi:hypothetical protein
VSANPPRCTLLCLSITSASLTCHVSCYITCNVTQSAREALKAKLKSDPSFRKELRKRVTDALLAKSDEDPKTAQYNFDAYMLTGALHSITMFRGENMWHAVIGACSSSSSRRGAVVGQCVAWGWHKCSVRRWQHPMLLPASKHPACWSMPAAAAHGGCQAS